MTQASAGDQLSLEGTQPPRVKKQSPRVPVEPDLLIWARERAGFSREDIVADVRFKKFPDWEEGISQPTFKQLEAFAKKVHVATGYLLLTEPPEESLPIADFRTFEGKPISRPSPELLDTIYTCEERQDWYRDYARAWEDLEIDFVGSATVETPIEKVAQEMREIFGFEMEVRRKCRNWEQAFNLLINQAEAAGVLVMVNGFAESHNSRPLKPEEFRGFALSDSLAPLVFVNGKDTKAAQIFTLAHELAHLWLGESSLSNIGIQPKSGFRTEEVWCNKVAAEFLVPLAELRIELRSSEALFDLMTRLSAIFKVSTLVILRRLFDAQHINRQTFSTAWEEEIRRLVNFNKQNRMGRYSYSALLTRVSRRFATALIESTLEGKTLYTDAFWMLGISKAKTFDKLCHEVGVSK